MKRQESKLQNDQSQRRHENELAGHTGCTSVVWSPVLMKIDFFPFSSNKWLNDNNVKK